MKWIEANNELMLKKDGFFQLEKDKEAVKEYFKDVKRRMLYFGSVKERIEYMIENNFYYNVLEEYTVDQIKELTDYVNDFGFEYQSYMAIFKFYNDYALKSNDKKNFLEFYEDRIVIVSLYLAHGNFEKAKWYATALIEQRYQPATPTFLNAGKARRGEMISCFLLGIGDSLNYINFVDNTDRQLSKIGGGVNSCAI